MLDANAANAGFITLGGDLRVPRLGFGAMRVTGEGVWGEPPDPDAARRLLQRAVALGVRFIDTADSYGPAVSERLIAEALIPVPRRSRDRDEGRHRQARPAELGDGRQAGAPAPGLRSEPAPAAARAHRRVPAARHRSARAARGLGRGTRAAAAGGQDSPRRRVEFQRRELERARRIVPVVSVQNRYNFATARRTPVLEVCERDGIAFLPWSPLAQGQGDARRPARRQLERLAVARGWSVPQASVAWLLGRSPAMLPIPGTSRIDHLEQLVAAASFNLPG